MKPLTVAPLLALAASAALVVTGTADASTLRFRDADREAVYVQHIIRHSSDPKAYCSAPTDRLIQCETKASGHYVRLDMTKATPTLAKVCVHMPGDLVAPRCFTQAHRDARANPWF